VIATGGRSHLSDPGITPSVPRRMKGPVITMKKIGPKFIKLSALALLWLCFSATIPAQDIAAKVDEYMNAGLKLGRFSSAVLIARDDKALVSNGDGVANYDEDVPILPFTKFRLASVTKQFTAMGILILQERGNTNLIPGGIILSLKKMAGCF